ncbi:MAG: threonine/serine dehydratase [Myxococcota bacterium]
MELVPFQALLDAQYRIEPHLTPTPLKHSSWLSAATGAQVWLKLEIFQPTGSFKVRGALNRVLAMPEALRERGVITASGGNHGLGVAMAGQLTQTPVTVVLPESAPKERRDAIAALGAVVEVHGAVWNDANALAHQWSQERGATYISPFNHVMVMAGQGTLGVELIDQLPELDQVVVSVGGGGLISGVASAMRHLKPQVQVVGVEPEGSACMTRAVEAGAVVELERLDSIAHSLGTRVTAERPLAIVKEAVERMVLVSDRAAVEALVGLLHHDHVLVEPAASLTAAALLQGCVPDLKGKTVVLVMCGANTTLDHVMGWRSRFAV